MTSANSYDTQDLLTRLAIRERIDLYTDRLNHRAWDEFEDLWTEDCTWHTSPPIDRTVRGRKAMIDMLSTVQTYQHGFVFQIATGIVIELLGPDEARSRHTLQVVGDKMRMMGIYYDRLVREDDGVWRFARRDYQISYHEALSLPGTIHRMVPAPDPDWFAALSS